MAHLLKTKIEDMAFTGCRISPIDQMWFEWCHNDLTVPFIVLDGRHKLTVEDEGRRSVGVLPHIDPFDVDMLGKLIPMR